MLEPIFAQIQKDIYGLLLRDLVSKFDTALSKTGRTNQRLMEARQSEFDHLIVASAEKYNLDPALLKAVVQAESNFSANAVSHAGAKGLMQLMDSTARQLGVVNPFNPIENIDGGARFLSQLLQRYGGNETLALAAYNAGPGAIDYWGGTPPYQETQTYIPRILQLREQYREWEV